MFGIVTGGTAALIMAGYNTMAPRSQVYGRTFIGAKNGGCQHVALTFDDGPNDPHTLHLLDLLARYEVRGTFFLIGRFAKQRPDIVRAIAQAGHAIGNHTYTHPNLIFKSTGELSREIVDCQKALQDALGSAPAPLFRPPWGARTPSVLRTVRAHGYEPVMWSVSGLDWSAQTAHDIESKIMLQLRAGDVVLLHDGGHRWLGVDRSKSVEAAEKIIVRCKDRGLGFQTVPEMMAASAF